MGSDVALAAIARKVTGVIEADGVSCAVGHVKGRGPAPVHIDGIPGATLQHPISRFSVKGAIAVSGLPSVNRHDEEIVIILGNTVGGARLELMDRAVRIAVACRDAEVHAI